MNKNWIIFFKIIWDFYFVFTIPSHKTLSNIYLQIATSIFNICTTMTFGGLRVLKVYCTAQFYSYTYIIRIYLKHVKYT